MSGIPVVVVPKGGLPVRSVDSGAPVMTIADNGKGIPITYSNNGAPFVVRGGGQAWTPEQLFNGGQPGFWAGSLAPTSLRLFQDAAGTIPANQAGQPVGKVARAAGTVDASQATALSRPTLARWPKGGRRNFLSASDASQAAWSTQSAATTQLAVSAPAGAVPVRITPTASPGFPCVEQTVNMSGEVVLSAYGKAESYRYLSLGISQIGSRTFNLATGSVGTGVSDAGIEPAGDGWFRCWVKLSAVTNRLVQFGVSNEANGIWQSWTPNGTSSLLLAGVQMEAGSSLTPFQKVTSPNDVTEAGVPDVWHLYNDGGDSLPAVLPSGSYEIAWVTPVGSVSYASLTSDGTAGTNLLRSERMADVLAREGSFTAAEKAALEFYWQQRYAA